MNPTEHSKHPGVIETVKNDGIALVSGTGKIIGATVDTTEKVVTAAVKDVAKVGVGAEHAVVAVGGGAIRGVEKLAVGAEHAVADVAGGAVTAAGDIGSTVVDAARHTVHGNPKETKKSDRAAA